MPAPEAPCSAPSAPCAAAELSCQVAELGACQLASSLSTPHAFMNLVTSCCTAACNPSCLPQTVLQMGVGGGMKAGCNIWRALRDVRDRKHIAWRHLADSPLTEADLPRGIDMGDIRDMKSQFMAAMLASEKKAAAAGPGAGKGAVAPPAPDHEAAAAAGAEGATGDGRAAAFVTSDGNGEVAAANGKLVDKAAPEAEGNGKGEGEDREMTVEELAESAF